MTPNDADDNHGRQRLINGQIDLIRSHIFHTFDGGLRDNRVEFMSMNASHELQKLVDADVRFSLALEQNGWFSIRIGNYLTHPFATNYSPTFELAVAALTRAVFGWPMAS
jgi:hypothetical protein